MARYVTTEQYFDLIRKVIDDSWFDDKNHHPEDIHIAVETANDAVRAVLEALDPPPGR